MFATLMIPLLQLCLKLIPILYSWKFIKSEADVRELQRKFEAAIRKAEEGSLDSAKLKDQHTENEKELKQKRTKVGW